MDLCPPLPPSVVVPISVVPLDQTVTQPTVAPVLLFAFATLLAQSWPQPLSAADHSFALATAELAASHYGALGQQTASAVLQPSRWRPSSGFAHRAQRSLSICRCCAASRPCVSTRSAEVSGAGRPGCSCCSTSGDVACKAANLEACLPPASSMERALSKDWAWEHRQPGLH